MTPKQCIIQCPYFLYYSLAALITEVAIYMMQAHRKTTLTKGHITNEMKSKSYLYTQKKEQNDETASSSWRDLQCRSHLGSPYRLHPPGTPSYLILCVLCTIAGVCRYIRTPALLTVWEGDIYYLVSVVSVKSMEQWRRYGLIELVGNGSWEEDERSNKGNSKSPRLGLTMANGGAGYL